MSSKLNKEEDDEDIMTSRGGGSHTYCLLSNIPESFHSAELRNYFAVFTEAEKFDLFHFRHRPQYFGGDKGEEEGSSEGQTSKGTKKKLCCIVRFKDDKRLREFIRKYHMRRWMDKEGNELPSKVLISRVDLGPSDLEKFATKELRPPPLMPRGNIGTPNQHFLNLIKECKLPPSLIKKLGLEFPRGRVVKKYSKVPYDYGTSRFESNPHQMNEEDDEDDESEVTDGRGRKLPYFEETDGSQKKETEKEKEPDEEGEDSHSDDDGCEEWERHEALQDHRTSHGTMFDEDKQRLYEEKIELKWEKGGSGLVFYTDAQYWEAQEEDHDDWDVDMEGYYVPGGGDKDARDYMEMRHSERFQQGLEDISVFKKRIPDKPRRPDSPPAPSSACSGKKCKKSIGEFEKYTRGVGRKIMEKSGWKDGQGLGTTIPGIADALESEGHGPRDRTGLGYYGEKAAFTTKEDRRKRKEFADYTLNPDAPERIIIGTIYDKPSELDVQEPLKRRNAPTYVKRYDSVRGGERH